MGTWREDVERLRDEMRRYADDHGDDAVYSELMRRAVDLDVILAAHREPVGEPPVERAVVVERGWVTRRKSDGWISSYGDDARTGVRPAFEETSKLGAGMPATHWEMVYAVRTVTLEIHPAPAATRGDTP